MRAVPPIVGLHHVRLPVSDVMRSRDWYADVFGFEPRLVFEEADRVVGVVLQHESGLTLGLRVAPARAEALRGFCALALCVGERDDLEQWCDALDRLGVAHSPVLEGHLGWFVEVTDVDGIVVELHTYGLPTADEA